MLNIDALPENTGRLFQEIQLDAALQAFTLVSGTAIALQVGHRLSMDLDFCTFDESLPSYHINQFIQSLKNCGHQVVDATEPNKKAQFKINTGRNLDDYARDYVVDGVKVTFFAYDAPLKTRAFLASQEVLTEFSSFKVMSLQGLFATKSLVIEKRTKSRDLFDLWYLIDKQGFSAEEMLDMIEAYGDSGLIDQSIYVLTGETPIDEQADEGLSAVGVEKTLEQLYVFFEEEISRYQQRKAQEMFGLPRPSASQ
jgi:predicted nucleotidyltransferase component of viral defense system